MLCCHTGDNFAVVITENSRKSAYFFAQLDPKVRIEVYT